MGYLRDVVNDAKFRSSPGRQIDEVGFVGRDSLGPNEVNGVHDTLWNDNMAGHGRQGSQVILPGNVERSIDESDVAQRVPLPVRRKEVGYEKNNEAGHQEFAADVKGETTQIYVKQPGQTVSIETAAQGEKLHMATGPMERGAPNRSGHTQNTPSNETGVPGTGVPGSEVSDNRTPKGMQQQSALHSKSGVQQDPLVSFRMNHDFVAGDDKPDSQDDTFFSQATRNSSKHELPGRYTLESDDHGLPDKSTYTIARTDPVDGKKLTPTTGRTEGMADSPARFDNAQKSISQDTDPVAVKSIAHQFHSRQSSNVPLQRKATTETGRAAQDLHTSHTNAEGRTSSGLSGLATKPGQPSINTNTDGNPLPGLSSLSSEAGSVFASTYSDHSVTGRDLPNFSVSDVESMQRVIRDTKFATWKNGTDKPGNSPAAPATYAHTPLPNYKAPVTGSSLPDPNQAQAIKTNAPVLQNRRDPVAERNTASPSKDLSVTLPSRASSRPHGHKQPPQPPAGHGLPLSVPGRAPTRAPRPAPPQVEPPRLEIGQIDIVVEEAEAKPEPVRSVNTISQDFASRHYLRRL